MREGVTALKVDEEEIEVHGVHGIGLVTAVGSQELGAHEEHRVLRRGQG